ncbi:MAG: FAD-dependent oxidoreductase [Propionibacteriales bacterium]|nr:FAD-dependent oxidoreductase [Propionibacteriales bacterium]
MRVAVVGAGVVGASVARELVLRGANVTMFEQDHPGAGTSGTSFAWINSHEKRPDSYHRLNVAGCAEHERFAAAAKGSQRWHFATGNLVWAESATERDVLERRVKRLEHHGYPCRWLDPNDVRLLEPDVRVPPSVERVAYFVGEGYVLPTLLLARLLGEARDRGAELRYPARVRSVEPNKHGVDLVVDGQRERFDRVVSCVGRWTHDLVATAGAHLPLVDPEEAGGPAVGFLAYTGPSLSRMSRVLTTPRISIRPDGGGRLVLQALDLDTAADPASPPGPGSTESTILSERLGEVLTLGRSATIESIRVGQRVLPADGHTVAGFADEGEGLYVVATHSGVTLGPLLGRLVAAELLDHEESSLLADFRPDRFRDWDGAVTVAPTRGLGEQ